MDGFKVSLAVAEARCYDGSDISLDLLRILEQATDTIVELSAKIDELRSRIEVLESEDKNYNELFLE